MKEILSRLRPEVRKVFRSRDRDWMGRKNSLPKSPRWQKLWCSLRYITMHVSLKLMSAEGDWGVARMWELWRRDGILFQGYGLVLRCESEEFIHLFLCLDGSW